MPTPPALPPWPAQPPGHGSVTLRHFRDEDARMLLELARDPYLALIGSLPAAASPDEARDFIARQHGRWQEGAGFSFCIARTGDDVAVGSVGLWLRRLPDGLGSVGYAVAPPHRGRGYARSAVLAVCTFAATVPGLHRLEATVEPWNLASCRTIEAAGFRAEGLEQHPRTAGSAPVPMVRYVRALGVPDHRTGP